MSRLPLIQNDQAPPEVKEVFDRIEKNGARILNLYRMAAHSPAVLLNFIRLGNSLLARTKLTPKLRELAILRVASLTGSEYERAQHHAIALQAGVSEKQARAIPRWKESAEFDDLERAVLQYTDEVSQNVAVKDETFKALRRYLDEQETVELTISIGHWGMVARLLVPLQVDIDAMPEGQTQDLIGRRPKQP
ncbi:MAG: carboxymuconolactone decarboxylase family protein, partial [Chloroflexota bacterium]